MSIEDDRRAPSRRASGPPRWPPAAPGRARRPRSPPVHARDEVLRHGHRGRDDVDVRLEPLANHSESGRRPRPGRRPRTPAGGRATTSWSAGSGTPRAASITRLMSSRGDLPVLSGDRDDPPAVERAHVRARDTHPGALDLNTCHDLRLLGGALDRLDGGVDVDDVSLARAPVGDAPFPMTSSAPCAFCSPISAQIFELPMSQETRKFSGLAIYRTAVGRRVIGNSRRRRHRQAQFDPQNGDRWPAPPTHETR